MILRDKLNAKIKSVTCPDDCIAHPNTKNHVDDLKKMVKNSKMSPLEVCMSTMLAVVLTGSPISSYSTFLDLLKAAGVDVCFNTPVNDLH